MRSLLFVPADSERKLTKSLQSGSDVLIFDLEDAVSMSRKSVGRQELATFFASDTAKAVRQSSGGPALYVRVNDLSTGLSLEDLKAVMPFRPDGIVLPKCRHQEDLNHLAHYLDAFEALYPQSSEALTGVIAIVTETAQSIAGLDSYREAGTRLKGLMWGAEDLSGDLGALKNKDEESGQWLPAFLYARTRCLLAAAAAGVHAIDTVPTDIHNLEGLKQETEQAYKEGFSAKAAIHPAQVPVINAAMTPNESAVGWAQKVMAAFEASTEVGVATLDGKMLDTPHRRLAEKILLAGVTKPA